jgi:uncharacterized membrane protein
VEALVVLLLVCGLVLFVQNRRIGQRLSGVEADLEAIRRRLSEQPRAFDTAPGGERRQPAMEGIPPAAPPPPGLTTTVPVSTSTPADAAPPPDSREAADAPPAAEVEPPVEAARESLASLFERFVAGRLLIWVGGIALAVAGVFLVRYSIELG